MTEEYQQGYEAGFREGRTRREAADAHSFNELADLNALIASMSSQKAVAVYWDAEEEKVLRLLCRIRNLLTRLVDDGK